MPAASFPMAESADDPALYWVEPQQRGILPLDRVHVPRRLARTIAPGRFEIRIDTDFDGVIEGCAASRPGRRSTWINARIRELYGELFQHRPLPHRRGVARTGGSSAASMAWRSAPRSSARACSPTSATPARWRWCISSARLIHGGFTLLDTQFVTDHLRQFGTVEVDRDRVSQAARAGPHHHRGLSGAARAHRGRRGARYRRTGQRPVDPTLVSHRRRRPRVLSLRKLDERLDTIVDGRMRCQPSREPALQRVLDEKRFHARRHVERRIALDLAQGRNHRIGILGELYRARIGQKLARARQGEADRASRCPMRWR